MELNNRKFDLNQRENSKLFSQLNTISSNAREMNQSEIEKENNLQLI